VLSRETGGVPEQTFSAFETEPFESRLLFQSHYARLNNGRDVIVKVVHPEAENQLLYDLDLLMLLKNALADLELNESAFKSVVADGRKNAHELNEDTKPLAVNWADYADGRVLSGKEAYALGFVDQLGNFDSATAKAEELGEVKDKANLIEYRQRNDLAELFGMFGKSESRALKVDLGVELPKIRAGRMYFLSPLFLY